MSDFFIFVSLGLITIGYAHGVDTAIGAGVIFSVAFIVILWSMGANHGRYR